MNRDPGRTTAQADNDKRDRILRFQSLADGATFAGRYEVQGLLGSGGSGEVYRAFDQVAQSPVALKVLFPGAGQRDIERLRRETRVVRSLQHPGILRVHDIGESEGLYFTVSELLNGESLSERLRREGKLEPRDAERILRGVLEALDPAHEAGVIHRDIKPGNVFLTRARCGEEERVVLLDFGLAKQTSESGLTATGKFVGTPEYCSPEQIRGERNLTPATDMYACGITLWEMLTGRPPFHADSEVEIFEAHLRRSPPPVRVAMPGAPSRLRLLALFLLEKDPARRPQRPSDVLSFLDAAHWVSRARRARTALRQMTRGKTLRIATAGAGLLAMLACFSVWLSVPISVRPDGDRVVWKTRSGFEVRSVALPYLVNDAVITGVPGRRRNEAWVATILRPGSFRKPGVSSERWPPGLFRLTYPDGSLEPLGDTNHMSSSGQLTYPFFSSLRFPWKSIVCRRASDGSAALMAVYV